MWLYLEREMEIERTELRVLHVAPDEGIAPLLVGRSNLRYVSFDIDRHCDVRGDLTQTPFKSGAFDLILCSHVLQDIPDDKAAMLEIARLLAPDGRAVLLAPFDDHLSMTDEDPSETDPEERRRRFGQRFAVRIYGRDFPSRLEEAGLHAEVVDYAAYVSPGECEKWRLVGSGISRERLFICCASA